MQEPKIPLRTPEQTSLINMLAGLNQQGSQSLYNNLMGDPYAGFDPIRQNVMGSVGNLTDYASRIYGNTPMSPGLSDSLAALRQNFGMQRRDQQLSFLDMLLRQALQPTFEPIYKQIQPNPWLQVAGSTLGMLPQFFMGGR